MTFGGNTRDFGSFGEETNKITDLHQFYEEILFTERRDGVACIKRRHRDLSSDGVRDLVMASGHGRLKVDLEPSRGDGVRSIKRGPHDTPYCMEDPEQAFVEYASSRTNEAGEGLVSNFMASQDTRLSKFEADFKQQQSDMTNKIDTVLKAITDQIAEALSSDTVKNPKLSTSPTSQLQIGMGIGTQKLEEPEPTLEDEFQDLHLNLLVLEVLAHAPIYNAILDKYMENLELGKNKSAFVQCEVSAKMEDPELFTLPCRLGDSKPFDTLVDLGSCVNIIPLYLFKKLNIRLLEETDHIFGLADGTKSYPVGIVKDIEVHIGKLKLLNDFYVIDMKKDPETSLLVGRGFLATANVVIDCRMAKIAVGEGITRSVFGVKGVDLGEEEWEIARDAEINPFKDVLVFRRMNKPLKNGDGAWHAKIKLIDPAGEEFTKTLQSIPPLGSSPKEKVQGKSSTWTTPTTLDV
ncbi:MAK10-like protein [Tanacetum coccineum]